MSYPLTQIPTLAEFVQAVQARYRPTLEPLFIYLSSGQQTRRRLVRRLPSGELAFAVLPAISDDERLTVTMLRSLCSQLQIPPADFGLILDDDQE